MNLSSIAILCMCMLLLASRSTGVQANIPEVTLITFSRLDLYLYHRYSFSLEVANIFTKR